MEYYIQNKNAGFLGNSPMWWALNSNGYTANLEKAHKFTEAEARKIWEGNPEKNIVWPAHYIDNNPGIQRVVDSQYMESDRIRTWEDK